MDRQGQGAYIPQELLKELSKASNRLLIGIPCERVEGERRLALTPEAVDMLTDRGHRVLVEAGAGLGINYSILSKKQGAPPPVDTRTSSKAATSRSILRSISRNASSPFSAKSCPTVLW